MMTPDPPREDRNQEAEDQEADVMQGTFVVDWTQMDEEDDEMMFVPEGPHELDMGGSESEYSDDDEDDPNPQRTSLPEDESPSDDRVVQTQTRGHYQLLIPFPVSQRLDASSDPLDENPQEETTNVDSKNSAAPSNSSNLVTENKEETISKIEEVESETYEKREINLTEEKVETIKSVMQSFTLPSSSIPSWASEIDDDTLKKKLTKFSEPNK